MDTPNKPLLSPLELGALQHAISLLRAKGWVQGEERSEKGICAAEAIRQGVGLMVNYDHKMECRIA